jgi:hypothetical protein
VREKACSRPAICFARSLPLNRLEASLQRALGARLHADRADRRRRWSLQRAARKLAEFGYSNVALLDGGMAAWRAQACPCSAGVNVPSKALANSWERFHTPSISAEG